ncbi:MAG TPA: hypothetical protein VNM48_09580 [Chloroflexota bacterium]|nr:hypothetical protein [Chloroflexota bacterium]
MAAKVVPFAEAEKRHAVEQARRLMSEEGYSQNKASAAVGEDLGIAGRTVKRWAVAVGLPLGDLSRDFEKRRTAAATAVQTYDLARRLELNDFRFERVRDVATTTRETNGLKDLALAFGILTDKRRLEEGQATARTESQVSEVRQRLDTRLDELASRRTQKASA